jgi:predicted RNA-binding Zn ribbon-like protein
LAVKPHCRYTGVVIVDSGLATELDPPEQRREDMTAEAAFLLDLLNTLDERSFSIHGVQHRSWDELAELPAAARWLRNRGLLPKGRSSLATDDLVKVIELRRALRAALGVGAGHEPSASISEVNAVLANLPVVVRLDSQGAPALTGTTLGVTASLGENVARVVSEGLWDRLRMCAAPDCRWVFYDTSRNARGRWCSMRVCGNRDKTRRYRDRKASA